MNKNILFTLFAATLLLSACQTNNLVTNPLDEPVPVDGLVDDTGMEKEDAMMEKEGAMEDDKMIEGDGAMEKEGAMEGDDAMEEVDSMEKEDAMMEDESELKPTISLEITAKNWEFIPNTITVKEGDVVQLTLDSVDVDHGFRLADFGVVRELKPGKTEVVTFVADKKGTFSFTCIVYCGAGHSEMTGTLIVE